MTCKGKTFPVISTHAPRTGSDGACARVRARGSDFNPRSPHGERLLIFFRFFFDFFISTHAPRTGSDEIRPPPPTFKKSFQPTLPARGATRAGER